MIMEWVFKCNNNTDRRSLLFTLGSCSDVNFHHFYFLTTKYRLFFIHIKYARLKYIFKGEVEFYSQLQRDQVFFGGS